MNDPKNEVHDFWDKASCGEDLYLKSLDKAGYMAQMHKRYELEPYIENFAKFEKSLERMFWKLGWVLGRITSASLKQVLG
jgi:hypothetical protein